MFLRDVGKMSPDEHVLYNYWLVTLALLEIGIPWVTIQNFTPDEICLVLAVNLARKEKQEETEARQTQFASMRR